MSAIDMSNGEDQVSAFFASLPSLTSAHDTFDKARYRPSPDNWALVVTDIVDSTTAIANGRHKTVNFVAAMAIGALKNLCAPESIPFLFAGDGAVVMVPPSRVDAARRARALERGHAAPKLGLQLHTAPAPDGDIRLPVTDSPRGT